MKILIWFLCLFVYAAITTLFRIRVGGLGAIPTIILFAGTIMLAVYLCNKWDAHRQRQQAEQEPSDEESSLPFDEPLENHAVRTQTYNAKEINKGNSPVNAIISNGEKVCPQCGFIQKADRSVCWSCGQKFDN